MVCCFEGEAYQPNTTISTTFSEDSNILGTVECIMNGSNAKMVFRLDNDCPKQTIEKEVSDVKRILEEHTNKTSIYCCIFKYISLACFCQTHATVTAIMTRILQFRN